LWLVTILVSPTLIEIFFSKYADGILSLQIMSLSLAPFTISAVINAKLQARESTKIGYSGIIRIGSLLALIALLSEPYGLIGLAISVVSSTVITMIFLIFLYRQNQRVVIYSKSKLTPIWPNFFIVGAPRCATTTLYEYLNQTPDVFMSPIKEPNFFSVSINPKIKLANMIRDKQKYLNLFKNVTNERAIGEASPTYLWDPKTPELIHKTIPDARIIMILRNPVERAFSHYLLLVSLGAETSSFFESLKKSLDAYQDYSGRILESGLYYEQVKRYYEIFDPSKIKVLIFEEFISDTQNKVKEVLDFLEVPSNPPNSITEVHNAFKLPRGKLATTIISNRPFRRMVKGLISENAKPLIKKIFTKESPKPILSPDERKFLNKYYAKDVKKLQDYLQRPLPWKINQDTEK